MALRCPNLMKHFTAIEKPNSLIDLSDDDSDDCVSYHMLSKFGFSLSAGRHEVRLCYLPWAQLKAEKQMTVPHGAPYLTLGQLSQLDSAECERESGHGTPQKVGPF
jgi:hypothetical protein